MHYVYQHSANVVWQPSKKEPIEMQTLWRLDLRKELAANTMQLRLLVDR